jgi:hypothetical protein
MEIIKSLMESYFAIVRKNNDLVPKTINKNFVTTVRDSLQNELVSFPIVGESNLHARG